MHTEKSPYDLRLIEEYFPLGIINSVASREKLHPRHYVSLVHYWPARRPTTACRAAIYATLVPATQSEDEREKARSFISKLATFKPDQNTIDEAKNRIRKYHGGTAPKVLDMFAGGGAIPLEAARLGCESHAVDYNSVAHLIELCTLVYPQKYGEKLATEFEYWGQIVFNRMKEELDDLYPSVQIPEVEAQALHLQKELFKNNDVQSARKSEPVAYIWARTVPCRHPGCDAPVPLVRQAWLRKKKGAVAAVPRINRGGGRASLCWDIKSSVSAKEISSQEKQTGAGEAVCVACGTPIPTDHVKDMALKGKMDESLAAVVVQGAKSKLYLPPQTITLPSDDQIYSRLVTLEKELGIHPPDEILQGKLRDQLPNYGFESYRDLFTPRQLLVLLTLAKHIRNAHAEMLEQKMRHDRACALTTYLAMAFSRFAIAFNKFTRWEPRTQRTMAAIGDRQALKMVYDFSEINGFAHTQGCLSFALEREAYCIRELAEVKNTTTVRRGNAEKLFYEDETFDAIVTDPPYYSSIYYADLSAFFYVWLKRIIGDIYPEHFTLPTPPKRREAVAQPSEHGGDSQKAKEHYQNAMRRSFTEARRVLKPGAPLVCVYAHKTTEGWATLIRALVDAGLMVTEAWPVQTESRSRMNTLDAAALSDSIFFVARRREKSGTGEYETDVSPELLNIACERVATLWAGGKGIGGADLLMAAVGAGLRAYTKFEEVEYSNGDSMSAEEYLREVEGVVLDTILDEIFGFRGAAVGSVDPITRFYVLWRFTYREASLDAGETYVFCYPQGIEINAHTGPSPSLIEKSGSKFRVRNYEERGEQLDIGKDNSLAPLIDVLHRMLWLIDNRPNELEMFLKTARPNTERLHLITQALCSPVFGDHETRRTTTETKEFAALTKLTANWRNLIEGAAFVQETDMELELPLQTEGNKL